ncbi:hypothetical protein QBC32DRAFT_391200 [Pseudoneurospora amorphoporcata]|uniref:Uncharacterized protein n=1 Tax=Pseudoneurospora amorphoporcata TaxID=241081 RepID=A0AAN6NXK5_9PEZI|nr:hypothetical protein QBC32DRAFT_391200 [Pseudoneurospora amorphoporcata]
MASRNPNADFPAFPQLPIIPSLSGEENFDVWHDALLLQMSYFDVNDIITGDEQAPASTAPRDDHKRFNRKKVLAYTILSNSIQPILTKVQALGYYGMHSLDPRSLYHAVLKWDSKISAEHKFRLVKELTDIHHSQFPNLHAFLDRALWLRRRLKRAAFDVSDELMAMLLLKGISSYDDAWTKMVLHGKTTGSLIEKDIVPLIAKAAAEQEAMSATSIIVCNKPTQEKGTQATLMNATEEKSTQATYTKAHQENGTQAESTQNQTYNEASNCNAPRSDTPNAWISTAADDDLKTIKPSDLTTTPNGVLHDTTQVGSQSMTTNETLNNDDSPTNTDVSNITPQSEVNGGSKGPNTNITIPSPTSNSSRLSVKKAVTSTAARDTNTGVTKSSNAQPSGSATNTSHQTDGTPQQPGGFGPTSNGNPQKGPHFVNPFNAVPGHINRQKQIHDWLLGNSWTNTEVNSWTNTENHHGQSYQNSLVSPSQAATSVQQPPEPPKEDFDPFGPETFACYLRAAQLGPDGKPRLRIKKRPFGPSDPRHW